MRHNQGKNIEMRQRIPPKIRDPKAYLYRPEAVGGDESLSGMFREASASAAAVEKASEKDPPEHPKSHPKNREPKIFDTQEAFDLEVAKQFTNGRPLQVWAMFQQSQRGKILIGANEKLAVVWSPTNIEQLINVHLGQWLNFDRTRKGTPLDSQTNILVDYAISNKVRLSVSCLGEILKFACEVGSNLLVRTVGKYRERFEINAQEFDTILAHYFRIPIPSLTLEMLRRHKKS